jgi:hypothetical protein
MDDRKIRLRQHAPGADWFLIEWRDHDGRRWEEVVDHHGTKVTCWCTSARLTKFSDTEGARIDMLDLAYAIEAHSTASNKRCAVDARGNGPVYFWSPRNSNGAKGEVSRVAAEELAAEIRRLSP